MTIEKLPSGSYRITQQENGHRYRITVDHKPSNTEAVRLLAKTIKKKPNANNPTFAEAYDGYIESKSAILSPATIRGYDVIFRAVPEEFKQTHLASVTAIGLQSLVNGFSVSHSPKSTRNFSGLILAVLRAYGFEVESPKLPQKVSKDIYIPTEEDVRAVLEEVAGTEYEVAIRLAVYGLRRSEICALTPEDLNGNILTVNKALVRGREEWHIKQTKTAASTRKVILDGQLADLIRQQGYVYKYNPVTLEGKLKKVQKKLGIHPFSLHKLRHFFASYMHDLGFSDKQIQAAGGWSTDNVMKTVYMHAMQMEEAKEEMAQALGNLVPTEIPTKKKKH